MIKNGKNARLVKPIKPTLLIDKMFVLVVLSWKTENKRVHMKPYRTL